jgi:hypothetical protein
MVLVVLALFAGVVALGFHLSARSIRELRANVRLGNSMLEAVSRMTGLEITFPEPYAHPTVGTIEGYARLNGMMGERRVKVGIASDYGYDDVDALELVIWPRPGVVWPSLGFLSARRARGRSEFLAAAFERLKPRVERILVEPTSVRIVLRGKRTGSWLFRRFETGMEPPYLVDTMRMAMSLADELDRSRR